MSRPCDDRQPPDYLQPYIEAGRRHRGGFGSLLWATPSTQRARFEAIRRITSLSGKKVLDVGCGRADLLDYLVGHREKPSQYTGIEAMAALADAGRAKNHANCQIIEADFCADVTCLDVGADVILFCGSLNTFDSRGFYALLERAWAAARHELVFNFLCSPKLASAPYLTWHAIQDVLAFAMRHARVVRKLEDYLDGDCTMAMARPPR